MEIQTFIPTYPEKTAGRRQTKHTTLKTGEDFDYRRMRIRGDLLDSLDAAKPSDQTLTSYLNLAIERFLEGLES